MKKIFLYILGLVGIIGLNACQSDHNLDEKSIEEQQYAKAHEILEGDIVFYTHAYMNKESRTLLPKGCPTKFNFRWEDDRTLRIGLDGFTVGRMPLTVYFYCNCKFMELNSWDKDEHKGSGWVKFKGTDGFVSGSPHNGDATMKGSGATCSGFLNVETQEVEFIVNYNMMNVTSNCYLQKVDKSLLKDYDKLFKQFEIDLAKYKEEHGLN